MEYFLMTFTVPSELRNLILHLREKAYQLMFKASSDVIVEMMERKLGVRLIGMTSMLHTWGSELQFHPHIHVLVPGGGLNASGQWKSFAPGFGLLVKNMSKLWNCRLR